MESILIPEWNDAQIFIRTMGAVERSLYEAGLIDSKDLPLGEKMAQLKSSRSFTFVEKDVRCSVIPICSAIEANRLLKISSSTGSAVEWSRVES